jgi:glutathione synthase/RimK-type ligase-like ATP-grasp enzyme
MKIHHLIVRSRNISCAPLKSIVVPRPTILRLGSTTPTSEITKAKDVLEINTAEACRISSDKILMKKVFVENNIPTAEYIVPNTPEELADFFSTHGTLICKHKHSSKGNRIYLLSTIQDVFEFSDSHKLSNYVVEKYHTYSREYRIHVTKFGCFYASRKMLKNDAIERWHRHSSNSVWILEDSLAFDKPVNWQDIVQDCVKALNALGLDIAAFDVKVSNNKHKTPKYIILESNSAPSLGDIGIQEYTKILTRITQNG